MEKTKLVAAALAAVMFLTVGVYFLNKSKKEPQVPVPAAQCLSQTECWKACVAINGLLLERLKDAKRLSDKEEQLVFGQAKEGCEYACKEVKNAP